MKNCFRKYLLSAIIILLFGGFTQVLAQPTGYCDPCNLPGWQNFCGWWRAYCDRLLIEEVDGDLVLDRREGFEGNYIFTKVVI